MSPGAEPLEPSGDAPPTRPADEGALGFERKPMVRWFDPGILADAALRVGLSSVFGAYADKREMQAAIDPPPHEYGPGDDGALDIDFVADLGDGFDSTYAVACLLGRQSLQVADGDDTLTLPRGRLLVMGGDQVYPSATREDYENRLRGPYQAALPWAAPGVAPHLFALPGNHDWYDGLTNFLRIFCSRGWIGGWQTFQRRSYFALRLPHRWWVLGIDIQLDTYIDEPQLEYFRGVGLKRQDRVILVTGKPSWVKVRAGEVPDSYKNLRYFKDRVIRAAGAEVIVTLTGDLHHYCRYEGDDGKQLITAGGGGAYLFPTHTMPERLELPDEPGSYRCVACFPRRKRSRRMAWGALRMPRLAPRLCAVLAATHGAFAASLFAARKDHPGMFVVSGLIGFVELGALVGYADGKTKLGKRLRGASHAAAQLAPPAMVALWAEPLLAKLGASTPLGVGAAGAVVGFVVGGFGLGVYLVISHRAAPKHANDVFACQSIPDWKNFLRLRIEEDKLTIYAIGVERVPRGWAPAPTGAPADPWLEPTDGPLEATLIEPPITVSVRR